jgi:hypothetical protein
MWCGRGAEQHLSQETSSSKPWLGDWGVQFFGSSPVRWTFSGLNSRELISSGPWRLVDFECRLLACSLGETDAPWNLLLQKKNGVDLDRCSYREPDSHKLSETRTFLAESFQEPAFVCDGSRLKMGGFFLFTWRGSLVFSVEIVAS